MYRYARVWPVCRYLRWGTRLSQLGEIEHSISVLERATAIVDTIVESETDDDATVNFCTVVNAISHEYAEVYLRIMVQLLQQLTAFSAMRASEPALVGKMFKLSKNLNRFVDR